jgi:hypothetical protein
LRSRYAPLQTMSATRLLDLLHIGTPSDCRLIAPVDSDGPGSKEALHGPHTRPTGAASDLA